MSESKEKSDKSKNEEIVKELNPDTLGTQEELKKSLLSGKTLQTSLSNEIIEKPNILLKALEDFSKRYNLDNKKKLSNKIFLLTFQDIISLVKDAIDYQNQIYSLESFQKEKLKDISLDFINNLSYIIFSLEKEDFNKNKKRFAKNSESLSEFRCSTSTNAKKGFSLQTSSTAFDNKTIIQEQKNYKNKNDQNKNSRNANNSKRIEVKKINTLKDKKKEPKKDIIIIKGGKNKQNVFDKKVYEDSYALKKISSDKKLNRSTEKLSRKVNNKIPRENSSTIDCIERKNIFTDKDKEDNKIDKTYSNKKQYVGLFDEFLGFGVKKKIFSNVPKPSFMANKILESGRKLLSDFKEIKEQESKKATNY